MELGAEHEYHVREPPHSFPDSYYKYRLRGIVIHQGTAGSGHYYSIIRAGPSRGGQWVEFNDKLISIFDARELENVCFGGKDNEQEKDRNAYLLFYEREAFFDLDGRPLEEMVDLSKFRTKQTESREDDSQSN